MEWTTEEETLRLLPATGKRLFYVGFRCFDCEVFIFCD